MLDIDPEGYDLVWVACDRDGHLAAFVTAGRGPIPIPALSPHHEGQAIPSLEDIETIIKASPKISDARIMVPKNSAGDISDFIMIAERGFFAYDWTDMNAAKVCHTNAYELIAVPHHPLTLETAPPTLAPLVAQIRFLTLSFNQHRHLDIIKNSPTSNGIFQNKTFYV